MTLSTDERRALGIIAALILLASGARWLERPQPLLADAPAVDVAALEEASRAAQGTRARSDAKSPVAASTPARVSAAGAPRPAAAGSAQPAATTSPKVDPNTAGPEELMRLPGVGPALAGRIIEERGRAPFRSIGDLERVRGIGAALAKRMALHVALPDVAAPSGAAAPAPPTPVQTAPKSPSGEGPRGPFDINTIGSADLQKVPGVGPVLAARILARRDSLGRFRTWEQVDEVAGVGPAMMSRLKESTVLRP